MAIFRIGRGAGSRPLRGQAEAAAQQAGQSTGGRSQERSIGDYEPPALMVIGSVRDLTAGSAASGNKDANSQYYW